MTDFCCSEGRKDPTAPKMVSLYNTLKKKFTVTWLTELKSNLGCRHENTLVVLKKYNNSTLP